MTPQQVKDWPLMNWRHVAATAATVLVLVFVVGQIASADGSGAPRHPKPAATATATATPTARPSADRVFTGVAEPTQTPTATPEPTRDIGASTVATATAFTTAWARPTLSHQAWMQGIAPYVTPALASMLSLTDPAKVPASAVGPGEAMQLVTDGATATVQVPTSGGSVKSIQLTLVRSVDAAGKVTPWLVSDVAPAEPANGGE